MNALGLIGAVLALQGGASAAPLVRITADVTPDSVAVGEPATLTVRVFAPEGTRIVFPVAIDSTGTVEPLDPVVVRAPQPGDDALLVATYRFLAWKPGATTVPIAPVAVGDDGGLRTMEVPSPRLLVTSVLPADTAFRVPKAARDIVTQPPSRLLSYALILAGLMFAALVAWVVRRRRRRRTTVSLDPYADAQRAFGRLSALDLIGAGEPARHVATAADVLRDYLATRDARAARGLTTRELVTIVSDDVSVPARRVESLLTACDVVKFAPESVDARTAESLASEAEAIVLETHRAARQHAGNGRS